MNKETLARFATVGKRLEYLRQLTGLSQDDVALRIGKTQPTILAYEKDKYKNIPVATLEKLAKLYGVKPEDITQETNKSQLEHLPYDVRKFILDIENKDSVVQMYKEYQLKRLQELKD